MKSRNNFLLILLLYLTFGANAQKLAKTDLGTMYSEYYFTGVNAVIYHATDDSSSVYLNINLHHFLYQPNEQQQPEANFKVQYSVYPTYNSKAPIDAGSLFYSDTSYSGEAMEMAVDFNIGISYPGTYVLKIVLTDLNDPENSVIKVMNIYKESRNSAQNFFLTDENEYPIFNTSVVQSNYFKIRHHNKDVKEFIIRYYNRSFPIAKTPFALEKNVTYTFEPDSFYTIALEEGITPLLELKYPGIYHIQTDIALPEGLTLYRFDDGFPEVSSPAQAMAPLRYLTTEREFDKLIAYSDYKTAVDSFWLERASHNPERAKNMIKKYYQRVVAANTMFSSFHEGWKTDRGLAYIIYGPPSEVYRKDDEEEWIYGEKGNPLSIRFYFLKVDNPFSSNDYSLQRSPIYKTSWYIAVENWRR